jgi:hypothetical protein
MKLDNSYLSFSMCSKSTLSFCSIFSDGKKETEGLPPEKKEPIKEYVNLNFEDFFMLMKLKINYQCRKLTRVMLKEAEKLSRPGSPILKPRFMLSKNMPDKSSQNKNPFEKNECLNTS